MYLYIFYIFKTKFIERFNSTFWSFKKKKFNIL